LPDLELFCPVEENPKVRDAVLFSLSRSCSGGELLAERS